jgi:DNA-binding winged helix-turn-helix (wHTH) protein/tetratricopeptide (TPR) repeat protein
MSMTAQSYIFGRFRVFVATRELRDGDALVELPARAFDCLVYLIEHRDRAVGRDELIAAVWGRADVSEALLNHTILKIRRAIGGGGQEPIRTVPRFGYRWTGIVTIETSAQSPGEEARATAAPPLPVSVAAPQSSNAKLRSSSRRWLVAASVLLVLAVVALISVIAHRQTAITPPAEMAVVATEKPEAALPALVLPAVIDAPEDWAWLRFGIMDLVANRLRSGSLRTAPSESVVALLKQRPATNGDALLADPSLARVAALRVLPRVRFDHGKWIVQLDAVGIQRKLLVDAESDDPIAAAREASNRLLLKLGHATTTANASDSSPMLDDLLQRSGAAMLADQLDQARLLIEEAAPALRDAAPLQQRMAQIELRSGEYDAVDRRLLALLDRLAPARDAALRARVLITLASAYVRRDQFDKADEAYAEAIALRGDTKDPEVLGIAYLGRGIVLAQRSRFDDAVAELGRARIELETAGDPLGVAQVDVNLGDFQAMRHRPADALPLLESAARQFSELGAREGLVYALIGVGATQRELLDPAAALATTDRFWPPEANTSNPRMQWKATLARAAALAANGRLHEAQALIEHIRADSDPKRDAALRVQTEAIAADVAMRRGDAADAARLAGGASTPMLRDGDKTLYTRTLLLETTALQDTGKVAEASASAKRLRAWAAEAGDDWTKLQAALAEARQAWIENRRDAALQSFAATMQEAGRFAIPDDLVAVGAAYADALIDIGHIDEARSIAGRIAPWADRDARAAFTQVRLYRALGSGDAERSARRVAMRLAGEGKLPADMGAENPAAAR